MFQGKKILVTGGTGMIGRPLSLKLRNLGAQVRIVSLDDLSLCPPGFEFKQLDLTQFENCMEATRGIDFVFHLAGIKGSPAMAGKKPASFFYPTISFNTNMLEAARRNQVSKYLFTSSVGVYAPADVFFENDVWQTFPSENDRFAGWAKRMGELQLQAYQIEYGWKDLYCVRPANVYGPHDNFDPSNAMVIPSLIHRITSGENPFVVWGDGSAVRDFIFSEDCADGILQVFQSGFSEPVNLGSGTGVSIRELVETLVDIYPEKPELKWDSTKPSGDRVRILNTERAQKLGIRPQTSLREGLQKTLDWYLAHRSSFEKRYNVFR